MDGEKRLDKNSIFIRINIEKTFDEVEWFLIPMMLKSLGFGCLSFRVVDNLVANMVFCLLMGCVRVD